MIEKKKKTIYLLKKNFLKFLNEGCLTLLVTDLLYLFKAIIIILLQPGVLNWILLKK